MQYTVPVFILSHAKVNLHTKHQGHRSTGIILRSQLANFSQFWSEICYPWDQCKSGEKRFSLYAGGSGRLFLTAWSAPICFARVHFSRIFARPEWSLVKRFSHESGDRRTDRRTLPSTLSPCFAVDNNLYPYVLFIVHLSEPPRESVIDIIKCNIPLGSLAIISTHPL